MYLLVDNGPGGHDRFVLNTTNSKIKNLVSMGILYSNQLQMRNVQVSRAD